MYFFNNQDSKKLCAIVVALRFCHFFLSTAKILAHLQRKSLPLLQQFESPMHVAFICQHFVKYLKLCHTYTTLKRFGNGDRRLLPVQAKSNKLKLKPIKFLFAKNETKQNKTKKPKEVDPIQLKPPVMSSLSMTGQLFCSNLATCYSFVTQVCIRYWTRWKKAVTKTQTNYIISLYLQTSLKAFLYM